MRLRSLQSRLAVRLAVLLIGVSLAGLAGLISHAHHVEAQHGSAIVHDVLREFFVDVAWAIPVIVVLALAIGIWSIRRDIAPLTRVSDAVQRVAPGETTTLATTPRLPSEVVPLVTAVDGAFERLQQAYDRERQITADAAHQLRTPLAVLVSGIEALPASAQRAELLTDATRMQRMIAQLLELARVDAGSGSGDRTCDVSALVADIARDMAPMALSKGVEVTFDAPPARPIIRADSALVEVITRNLVDNAIAHAPAGSTVALSMTANANLIVEDAGPGIPEGERDAVFQRFRRGAWSTHAGSGLGLAIVRAAADRLGASVQVGDSTQRGARFTVAFARVQASGH